MKKVLKGKIWYVAMKSTREDRAYSVPLTLWSTNGITAFCMGLSTLELNTKGFWGCSWIDTISHFYLYNPVLIIGNFLHSLYALSPKDPRNINCCGRIRRTLFTLHRRAAQNECSCYSSLHCGGPSGTLQILLKAVVKVRKLTLLSMMTVYTSVSIFKWFYLLIYF